MSFFFRCPKAPKNLPRVKSHWMIATPRLAFLYKSTSCNSCRHNDVLNGQNKNRLHEERHLSFFFVSWSSLAAGAWRQTGHGQTSLEKTGTEDGQTFSVCVSTCVHDLGSLRERSRAFVRGLMVDSRQHHNRKPFDHEAPPPFPVCWIGCSMVDHDHENRYVIVLKECDE